MAEEEIREQDAAGESVSQDQQHQPDAEKPAVAGGSTPWGRLFLVAVVAAILGAFATANWHDMPFSMLVGVVNMKAGVVILISAALGFVLGVVFLWSSLNKRE